MTNFHYLVKNTDISVIWVYIKRMDLYEYIEKVFFHLQLIDDK